MCRIAMVCLIWFCTSISTSVSGISIRGGSSFDDGDFVVGGSVLEELGDDLAGLDSSSFEESLRFFWLFAAGPDGPALIVGAVVLSYSRACRVASSRVYAEKLVKGQSIFFIYRLGMSLLMQSTAPVIVW